MKKYNCSQELMEDFDFVRDTATSFDEDVFVHTANS